MSRHGHAKAKTRPADEIYPSSSNALYKESAEHLALRGVLAAQPFDR
jgi:hypothetical protein